MNGQISGSGIVLGSNLAGFLDSNAIAPNGVGNIKNTKFTKY